MVPANMHVLQAKLFCKFSICRSFIMPYWTLSLSAMGRTDADADAAAATQFTPLVSSRRRRGCTLLPPPSLPLSLVVPLKPHTRRSRGAESGGRGAGFDGLSPSLYPYARARNCDVAMARGIALTQLKQRVRVRSSKTPHFMGCPFLRP